VTLIDLDRPAERPARPPWRRPSWRLVRGTAVAMLAGAVLGGLVTYGWTVERRRDADERTASVLLFADTRASEIGVLFTDTGGPDQARQVTFHAAIAVVNAGPRPLRVRGLTVRTAGVTVIGSGAGPSIASRTSSLVDVDVTATCFDRGNRAVAQVTIYGGVVPAAVSVETASGSIESVAPVDLDTTGWATQWAGVAQKCLESWPIGS
jgi:hypothetical protein